MRGVPANLKKIEAAIKAAGGNIALAARSLKCERHWLSRKIHKSNTLEILLNDLRESSLDHAESALGRAIEKGEGWAICFFLKTQGKQRGYIEKQEVQAEVKTTTATSAREMTNEQLDAAIAAATAGTVFGKESPPPGRTIPD